MTILFKNVFTIYIYSTDKIFFLFLYNIYLYNYIKRWPKISFFVTNKITKLVYSSKFKGIIKTNAIY